MSNDIKLCYNIASIKDFNFWGIPKCGNTTIKYKLLKKFKPEKLQPIDDTCKWVHDPSLMTYLTPLQANSNGKYNFTFIRNPIAKFTSIYKDFCLYRKSFPFSSPEELLNELKEIKQDEANHNIHLRSISYFLKKFEGDIFNIDDLNGLKLNRHKKNLKFSDELIKEIKEVWKDDFSFFEKIQNINKFKQLKL